MQRVMSRTCWTGCCVFPCEVIKSVGVVFWLQCTYKVQLCHLLGLTHQCSMPVRRDCFLVVAQLALRQPSSLFTVPCGVRMDEIDIRNTSKEQCELFTPALLTQLWHTPSVPGGWLLCVSCGLLQRVTEINSKCPYKCVIPLSYGMGSEVGMCHLGAWCYGL